MDRRTFVQAGIGAATVAGSSVLAGRASAEDQEKIGAGLRTKIAVSPTWFEGSHVEQIEQIAAAGLGGLHHGVCSEACGEGRRMSLATQSTVLPSGGIRGSTTAE